MSDTPRTDEQEYFIDGDRGIVDSALARELERELHAANKRIKRLEAAGDSMFRMLEHDGCESVGQNMWKQAKKAKP